jgi:Spy/CpxP family protein refolding chaperone
MKSFGITIGLILLSGNLAAFGQSLAEQDTAKAADLLTFTQLRSARPYALQIPSTAEPTAALQTGLQGTWWRDSRWVQTLDLTADQQRKMDDAFRQNRIKLIDLMATLEKAELMLEPLVESVKPGDEPKILAQIDDVANARAELEKANARLLLAIRQVLTQDQWNKLPKARTTTFSFSTGNAYFNFAPRTPATPGTPATPAPK